MLEWFILQLLLWKNVLFVVTCSRKCSRKIFTRMFARTILTPRNFYLIFFGIRNSPRKLRGVPPSRVHGPGHGDGTPNVLSGSPHLLVGFPSIETFQNQVCLFFWCRGELERCNRQNILDFERSPQYTLYARAPVVQKLLANFKIFSNFFLPSPWSRGLSLI